MASHSDFFWQNGDAETIDNSFLIDGERHLTYRDAFVLADSLYSNLERGVVLILFDRSVEMICGYIGALRHGIVPLLVDAGAVASNVESNIASYSPRHVLAGREWKHSAYQQIAELGSKALFTRCAVIDSDIHPDLALLLPTSGSTGDPKCVRLTRQNLTSVSKSICQYLDMESDRRAVSILPLHYSYGLSVLHCVMQARAGFVLTELTILDRDLWKLIADKQVTDFAAVPFMLEMMRRMKLKPEVFNALKCVTQAGGPLKPDLTSYFLTTFEAANIKYLTMYGQTEASPRITYTPPERAMEKLGSVGIAIPGGAVSIRETGMTIGEGELVYKGPNVCMGYAHSHEDLSRGDEFKGTLHTGDIASIDEDGFVTIVGRKKRMVKVHGISVSLDAIEQRLKSEGFECGVIGKDNLIIICYLDVDEDLVAAKMKEHFKFAKPTIKYRRVDDIPLTSSGKPDYVSLSKIFS